MFLRNFGQRVVASPSQPTIKNNFNSADQLKMLLNNVIVNDIPCVYCITISTVKNLRNVMNIDHVHNDDDLVCKYGRTKNFAKRLDQHKREYGKLVSAPIQPMFITMIPAKSTIQAEALLKNALKSYQFLWSTKKELVIIKPKDVKKIKNIYKCIGFGRMSELAEKYYKKELTNNSLMMLKE